MKNMINWAGSSSLDGSSPGQNPTGSKLQRKPSTPWSWKVTTIAGIDVHIHGTFVLLVFFVAFSDILAGQNVTGIFRGVTLTLAVFAAVLLHEFAHALTARRFGVQTLDITLYPIGGVARFEKLPEKPSQQLLVAMAGPALNLIIALGLFALATLLHQQVTIATLRHLDGPFLAQLMWVNLSLALFNLLPGFPMDGGRILRAILAMRMAPEIATQLAARVGQAVATILIFVGFFLSPMLVVIGVFVWLGARAEHSASAVRDALAGMVVRQSMITNFRCLSPSDALSVAIALMQSSFQQDFPVMDGERLVGVLVRDEVLRALAQGGRYVPIGQAMDRNPQVVGPLEELNGALTRLLREQCRVVIVLENGQVIGLLTVASIGEFMSLENAGRRLAPPGHPHWVQP
jgi:Zn-dependent protease/CBS domain-containing protein